MQNNIDKSFNLAAQGALEVFSKKRNLLSAVFLSLVLMFIALWISNFSLLSDIIFSSDLNFIEKVTFLLSSFEIFNVRFTLFSSITTVIVAILFSFNMVMMYYFAKTRGKVGASGTISLGGLLSGIFGIGCASCGSLILSFFGLSGAVLTLPFKGAEFNIIAIILLAFSFYFTSKKIALKICEVA